MNAGISPETIWTTLPRAAVGALIRQLRETQLEVNGKTMNKDEFVTCGGVRLREVNFKTMESRVTPHLYFAGELLDIDGITGGFNFQAAWTTGWIAGHAMAFLGKLTRVYVAYMAAILSAIVGHSIQENVTAGMYGPSPPGGPDGVDNKT